MLDDRTGAGSAGCVGGDPVANWPTSKIGNTDLTILKAAGTGRAAPMLQDASQ